MILTVNTALFYECLSRYLSWFKNTTPEYAAYVNSTINAGSLIFTESLDIATRMSLFSGYLINDTLYLLCKTPAQPKNRQFLIHHIFSLALTMSPYPQMYPDITTKLLVVERTIPIANAIWFLKYYNQKPTKKMQMLRKILKGVFFVAFTYYRVIHLSLMSYDCYKNSLPMQAQLGVYTIWAVNMVWYRKLVNMIES
jgi:hypothetical protein